MYDDAPDADRPACLYPHPVGARYGFELDSGSERGPWADYGHWYGGDGDDGWPLHPADAADCDAPGDGAELVDPCLF